MPTKTRRTIQGQTWDEIALAELGTESAMRDLILANDQARGVLFFSGEKKVSVPAVPEERLYLEALPPWRREDAGGNK